MMLLSTARPSPESVLRGRTVVFVGAGSLSKFAFYRAARSWGLRVILFHGPTDSLPEDCADLTFVVADLSDHLRDVELASEITGILVANDIQPGAVLTLWEDCVPLAALVANTLGLAGIPYQAALAAKSKFLTQSVLNGADANSEPQFGSRCVRCPSIEAVDDAVAYVGLPALLKLEYGSSAVGVIPVHSVEETRQMWLRIHDSLRCEEDCRGVGLGFGPSIVLTELLSGSEHDVDVVIHRGDVIAAFVTDNGPTRLPRYAEATAWMPGAGPDIEQTALVQCATDTCRGIGLQHGTFNVELIRSPKGPRVIDVNARMGGFYIRDWILEVWGYDILLAAILCAFDMKPPACGRPRGSIVGAMLSPSLYGRWLSEDKNRQRLVDVATSMAAIVNVFSHDLSYSDLADEPWGSVGVFGNSLPEAREALISLWIRTGLDEVEPDLWRRLPSVD